MLRMFFVRIVEWGWDDAPVRVPIFFGDVPKRDEPLPRFLDDATYTRFMRALATEPRLHRRVAIELLARTGMRVGELCDLEADAVTVIGDAHWLRIPLGKLHNDRYVPLHPHLVELLADYRHSDGPHTPGRLLAGEHGPLNRHVVARWIDTIARRAGIGHVNPHRLRHTLATQAINRGMSIEAIAALLGHRSLDMTRQYARIANRVVADEYNAVTAKVEALYQTPLPADAEGPNMRRLRAEVHHRLLGNGWCQRPAELDCSFESICESCAHFATGPAFRPVLLRQRNHAAATITSPTAPPSSTMISRRPRNSRSLEKVADCVKRSRASSISLRNVWRSFSSEWMRASSSELRASASFTRRSSTNPSASTATPDASVASAPNSISSGAGGTSSPSTGIGVGTAAGDGSTTSGPSVSPVR